MEGSILGEKMITFVDGDLEGTWTTDQQSSAETRSLCKSSANKSTHGFLIKLRGDTTGYVWVRGISELGGKFSPFLHFADRNLVQAADTPKRRSHQLSPPPHINYDSRCFFLSLHCHVACTHRAKTRCSLSFDQRTPFVQIA
jgi:hypothetical protein